MTDTTEPVDARGREPDADWPGMFAFASNDRAAAQPREEDQP